MKYQQHNLTRAKRAYSEGHLDEALDIIASVMKKTPHSGPLWELRGLIHRDRRQTQASVDAFERAALLIPLKPLSQILLAEGYGKLGRRQLARDLFVQLLYVPGMNVSWLLQVAIGLHELQFTALAMKACRVARQLDAEHPQPYYDMGFYASQVGYPAHVVEALARRAILLDPERVSYRVGLASLMMQQGRIDDARDVIVGHVTDTQITQIQCRCCLQRIADLFEQAGEWHFVKHCRDRITQLELSGIESDCD